MMESHFFLFLLFPFFEIEGPEASAKAQEAVYFK
jgi:hypothetical protein